MRRTACTLHVTKCTVVLLWFRARRRYFKSREVSTLWLESQHVELIFEQRLFL